MLRVRARLGEPRSGRGILGWALGALAILLIAVFATALWGWQLLRASLPITAGTLLVPGLSAPATVERDAIGVPTISAAGRRDAVRALGLVHAQERFFQMDLLRRKAAGELAELLGPVALPLDRAARIHRFRARAARVWAAAAPGEAALLAAYREGVNAGLRALRRPPPEYLMLRAEPAPWAEVDSILVLLAMFLELQDADGITDWRRGLMQEHLPAPLAAFLTALGSDWDTPLVGPARPPPPIPGPDVLDLRRPGDRDGTGWRPSAAAPVPPPSWLAGRATSRARPALEDSVSGSNAWALAGARTSTGAALLASDMHLGLAVPSPWFRAVAAWGADAAERTRVVGVTLPGIPSFVVGSNGRVAWGLTNAEIDTSDLVILTPEPGAPGRYRTPDGPRPFAVHRERIRVRGAPDEVLDVRETRWGPVVGAAPDSASTPAYALRWVAHDSDGLDLRFLAIEETRTLDEALRVAKEAGIPAQSCVLADAAGSIGWTIAGRIPRRVGLDGRVPTAWADGTRDWRGWLAPAEHPTLHDPPTGWILTANNRLVGGAALARLGEAGFDQGARARQIRDALLALADATPADMLRIQLDDRARFLARWRQLALAVLSPEALAERPSRHALRDLIERTWTGRASPDSVAYRLVRGFRTRTAELAFAPLLAPVRAVDPSFPPIPSRASEGALWQLVTVRPPHLLDPSYASWEGLLLAALDRTAADLAGQRGGLADRTWGEVNRLAMRHPLSGALSWLSWWLDMPAEPLPGDLHMPRVQAPAFGASERLVVAPGREAEGLFQMPGGQSGHPLSPAYRAGHRSWVEGCPAPLLPGPTVSSLRLVPPAD